MTDVIVNTVTDTVVIESEGLTTVITVGEQGPPGPSGIENISDAMDVDSSNKVEGSVLVYSTQNQKWVATTLLENQSVESGHY
jgi:hypothetical protein